MQAAVGPRETVCRRKRRNVYQPYALPRQRAIIEFRLCSTRCRSANRARVVIMTVRCRPLNPLSIMIFEVARIVLRGTLLITSLVPSDTMRIGAAWGECLDPENAPARIEFVTARRIPG